MTNIRYADKANILQSVFSKVENRMQRFAKKKKTCQLEKRINSIVAALQIWNHDWQSKLLLRPATPWVGERFMNLWREIWPKLWTALDAQSCFLPNVPRRRLIGMELPSGSDCPLFSKSGQEKARLHQIRITPLSSGIFFATIADF